MIDILIVVVPGTMLLDLAAVAETFRIATALGAAYRIRLVGPQSDAACSIPGLRLGGIDPLPENLPPSAIVLIPSSDDSASRYQEPLAVQTTTWLARVIRPQNRLCTICTGIFLAAQSGLLGGRRCTTHHLFTDRLRREHPELVVEDNRIFVQDGQFFSSAGATTALDLALHLVQADHGPKLALDVARMLVVYFRRSGDDVQLSPWLLHRSHVHPALHRVQDAVTRDPARAWDLAALAREAFTSPRHLTRLFNEHAGVSPMTYVRMIRMAAAKELVQASQHNLGRVAEMVGFSSGEQLRRAWRQFEGANPTEARRKTD